MRIIVHHTCDSKGEKGLTEIVGPFLSLHSEEKPKMLGTGYYFFDNNMTIAHAHGKHRYKRNYHIFEAELNLDESIFLDLVGNRIDMIWFKKMLDMCKPFLDGQQWKVGSLIEFLKQKGIFPYEAIRVLDSSIEPQNIKGQEKVFYFEGKEKFLNISPIFTICLIEKHNIPIKNFTHIYTKP